jgi:hypothetical protein
VPESGWEAVGALPASPEESRLDRRVNGRFPPSRRFWRLWADHAGRAGPATATARLAAFPAYLAARWGVEGAPRLLGKAAAVSWESLRPAQPPDA